MGRKLTHWELDAIEWLRQHSPHHILAELEPRFNAEARRRGWHPRSKAAIKKARVYYEIDCTKRKSVTNLDTGETYPSVSAAAAALHITAGALYMAISQKRLCQGHRWAYSSALEEFSCI